MPHSSKVKLPDIPFPFAPIYKFLYLDMVREDDDFQQILKKLIVLGCLTAAPGALYFIFFFGYLWMSGTDESWGVILSCIGGLFVLPAEVGGYLLARRRMYVGNTALNIQFWAQIIGYWLAVVGNPNYPTLLNGVIYMIVFILSRPSHWVPLTVLSFLSSVFAVWNETAMADPAKSIPVLFLDPHFGDKWEVNMLQGLGFGYGLITTVFVWLQGKEHIRVVEMSRSSNELSGKIVELIRKYDTDSMEAILAQYKDSADKDLVEAFLGIRRNLGLYRPYLPNYLFLGQEGSGEGSYSDVVVIQTSQPPSPSQLGMGLNPLRLDSAGFSTTGSGYGLQPGMVGTMNSLTSASLAAPNSIAAFPRTPTCESDLSSIVDEELEVGSRVSGSVGRLSRQPSTTPVTRTEATATFALINYPTMENGKPPTEECLTRFANGIWKAASETYASIHSFVGETVTVSWNVTHRVNQSEAKVAKFMGSLLADAKVGGFTIGGAAFTGIAVSHNITTAQQKATFLSAGWIPLLTKAYQLGCKYRAMLIDAATFNVAKFHAMCRLVDAVIPIMAPGAGGDQLSKIRLLCDEKNSDETTIPQDSDEPPPSPKVSVEKFAQEGQKTLLYEVVAVPGLDPHCISDQSGNAEWMYNVDAASKSPNAQFNQSVEVFVRRPTRTVACESLAKLEKLGIVAPRDATLPSPARYQGGEIVRESVDSQLSRRIVKFMSEPTLGK